ncbi:TPA: hypothetical protein I8352_002801 [Citrobacter koseri]|nr:hypothetical protein [Citrobacter koseri]
MASTADYDRAVPLTVTFTLRPKKQLLPTAAPSSHHLSTSFKAMSRISDLSQIQPLITPDKALFLWVKTIFIFIVPHLLHAKNAGSLPPAPAESRYPAQQVAPVIAITI